MKEGRATKCRTPPLDPPGGRVVPWSRIAYGACNCALQADAGMILFLTNCSLTKASGGVPDYDHAASIAAVLSPTLARQLLARRGASMAPHAIAGVPLAGQGGFRVAV